ncbi:hypothetical protein BC830DRAFT_848061 [Chytriomyces sp. MP71]|nr:hypothetical protein BC830DRAFT_848061 [Chytriomyces sp. MP71]
MSVRSAYSVYKRKSYVEYLNDAVSVLSSSSSQRLPAPEDTIAVMKLTSLHNSVVSREWWSRLLKLTKPYDFDGYEFISQLSESVEVSEDNLTELFAKAGAQLTETEFQAVMREIHPDMTTATAFLRDMSAEIRIIKPHRFYYKLLPIWSFSADVSGESIGIHDGLARMSDRYAAFSPDLFGFITETRKLCPAFDVKKFFDACIAIQGEASEENLGLCFKYAGIDSSPSEYRRLTTVLLGFWDLHAFGDFLKLLRAIGVSSFISQFIEISYPTVEQCKFSGLAWLSSLMELGPNVRFDPVMFQTECRAIHPVFTIEPFLEFLFAVEEVSDDSTLLNLFEACGMSLEDDEYENLVMAACGDSSLGLAVFNGWCQFIRLWGIRLYLEVIDIVLEDHRLKFSLVMTFLSRIYALGEKVQFNLRGFETACKTYSVDFSLQIFCANICAIPRLESDSLNEAFALSGIELEDEEVQELLVALFGDENLSMTGMRELHYILKKLGSDWSAMYMHSLVDQRQRVEAAVHEFKGEIQSTPVIIEGKASHINFTLRHFIERCKSFQAGWNTNEDFDLRVLLEKLAKISDHGHLVETLISAFKSVGIFATTENYEGLIASIAGGDYTSGLLVFQSLVVFLKKWGMEWNMWIVWTLLDDQKSNEDVLMNFLKSVYRISASAKFDLVSFIEICDNGAASSWAQNDFDLAVFMDGLMQIQGNITLESIEPLFRAFGIRTTVEKYSEIVTTLTGGEFDTTAVPVLTNWISFIKLWGIQWFVRGAIPFFERVRFAQRAVERLDMELKKTDNHLDVRTFMWFCESKNGAFKLAPLLTNLSATPIQDVTQDSFLSQLALHGVELSNNELENLIGVLTGAEGNDAHNIICDWLVVVRETTVRFYLLVLNLEWMWDAITNADTSIAIHAFHSRIKVSYEKFSVDRFIISVERYKTDWDLEKWFSILMEVHGELSLQDIVQAFKATGIDVTSEKTHELLDSLSGSVDDSILCAREWVSAARTVGIQELLKSEIVFHVKDKPEEG